MMMLLQLMLIFLFQYNVESMETCEFCYIRQPPAGLYCNPYKNITLQCTINFPTTIELQIKWFCEKSNSKIEIIPGNSEFSIRQETNNATTDNKRTSSSYLTISTNNIAGMYWCQVFHNGNSRLESQHLDIGHESDYDRWEYCSTVQTVEESRKCDSIFEDGASQDCRDASKVDMVTTSILLNSSINVHPTTKNFHMYTVPATPDENLGNSTNQFRTILYIAVGLAGVFIFLIIVLSLVCAGLCLTRSKKFSRSNEMELTTNTLYPELTSRPQTSMTTQTEIFMAPIPVNGTESVAAVYDTLDADYEDIDNNNDILAPTTPKPTTANSLPYHDQGPSTIACARKKPPPPLPMYSEVAPVVPPHHPISQGPIAVMTTGYNKLDHSRPRNYYPKKHSPLLSGYRKLQHLHFTPGNNNTLPPDSPQSGYANIEVPNLRSISLPNSEYSNLNHSSAASSQPSTPTQEKARHKYANLDISEDGLCVRHIVSDDYHMLADATADGMFEQEYEFLPTCDVDDKSPSLESQPSYRNKLIRRDSAIEKLSLDSSHSSADFTGPFIFPHMINFGDASPEAEPSNRAYRPLDVSSMEPQSGYTIVNVKRKSNNQ